MIRTYWIYCRHGKKTIAFPRQDSQRKRGEPSTEWALDESKWGNMVNEKRDEMYEQQLLENRIYCFQYFKIPKMRTSNWRYQKSNKSLNICKVFFFTKDGKCYPENLICIEIAKNALQKVSKI